MSTLSEKWLVGLSERSQLEVWSQYIKYPCHQHESHQTVVSSVPVIAWWLDKYVIMSLEAYAAVTRFLSPHERIQERDRWEKAQGVY